MKAEENKAKEKAEELLKDFTLELGLYGAGKKAALLHIDKVVDILNDISYGESGTHEIDYGQSFYKEIKKEILNP